MTILCEDTQQEAFALRFLKDVGWETRQIRVIKAPGGHGSAEQFIRGQFPIELQALRRQHGNVSLVTMVDGDRLGLSMRLKQLDSACDEEMVPRRRSNESAFVFVPTWCIETWLAYLDDESVREDKSDYPRLGRRSDCKRHVENLVHMCQTSQLREPAPPSLAAACAEYERFVNWAKTT